MSSSLPQENYSPLPGGFEEENRFGRFYLVEERLAEKFVLPFPSPELIGQNLSLIFGIGPHKQEKLKAEGYGTIQALRAHAKWGRAATEIDTLIKRKDLNRLRRYGARDEELIGFFPRSKLVFIDLETTGFYTVSPLFLVGILYFDGQTPVLKQFMARDYTEEQALLYSVNDYLRRFQVAISFNGKSFDLPYLKARMLYYGFSWESFSHQLDLLRQTRRYFRGTLPDCRLTTVGHYLLQMSRGDGISGADVPDRYHRFVETGKVEYIAEILLHNVEDLITMARLVKVIADRWEG